MPVSRGRPKSRNQLRKLRRKVRREAGLTGRLKRVAENEAKVIEALRTIGAARPPIPPPGFNVIDPPPDDRPGYSENPDYISGNFVGDLKTGADQ